jgi:hypothetical protein
MSRLLLPPPPPPPPRPPRRGGRGRPLVQYYSVDRSFSFTFWCCFLLCSLGCIKLRITASTHALQNIKLDSRIRVFYISTLLKCIQGTSNHCVLIQTFELLFGPTLRIAVSTCSFSLCVSFCSLERNGMGKEAEGAIKAAWAPRGWSELALWSPESLNPQ